MSERPQRIALHTRSRELELHYADGSFRLGAEFLRVHSPSAEVRGHGIGQEVLQTGKRDVALLKVEPSGNYALKLTFGDGHDTGLYSWDYLRELCLEQDGYWQRYLERLQAAGGSREASAQQSPKQPPAPRGGCGGGGGGGGCGGRGGRGGR